LRYFLFGLRVVPVEAVLDTVPAGRIVRHGLYAIDASSWPASWNDRDVLNFTTWTTYGDEQAGKTEGHGATSRSGGVCHGRSRGMDHTDRVREWLPHGRMVEAYLDVTEFQRAM
jgi:hypothetical protein